ncbi:MAG: cobyric acid synthase, partial [Cyanobacteria bacterium P01_D01_bin.1]
RLSDPEGHAGLSGDVPGLGLLPIATQFAAHKEVRQVTATEGAETWQAYEIHMGQTHLLTPDADCRMRSPDLEPVQPLVEIVIQGHRRKEGIQYSAEHGQVWGTYLHGLFEATSMRRKLARLARVPAYRPGATLWHAHQSDLYSQMADFLEEYCDLEPVRAWVGLD